MIFDNETEVIHDRVDIADVPNLMDKEYFVRGCTALLNAVGGAIHHIGNVHKYARKEDVPEKTLFTSPLMVWRMPAIVTPMIRFAT